MNSNYFTLEYRLLMGNILALPKDTVVLVPPRISTRGLTRPLVFENPISVAFGNLFRKEVLEDLHCFNGDVSLDVLMCPELPPNLAAHLSLSGSSTDKTIKGGAVNLHFNQQLSEQVSGLGRVTISGSDGLTGYAMFSLDLLGKGVLSLTGNLLNKTKSFGFRAHMQSFRFGCEVPKDSPIDAQAWIISRLSPSVSVGLQGHPLQTRADSPYKFSVCLDKQIDNTDSSYTVTASIDYPSKDVMLGFSQHLVTHRRIYNPLEEKHVKYIANYVDIAVEGRTKGDSNTLHDIAGGISWQLNKNLMAKMHVSTSNGVAMTGVVRNWWVPSFLASVSLGIDTKGKPFVGGKVQVSNWLSTVEYERGQPVSELPTTKWIAMSDVKRFNSDNQV